MMRIALVFDDLIQHGGAEKLFLTLIDIWPHADIFTAVISPEWASEMSIRGRNVHTSFIQKLPFAAKLNRLYAVLLLHPLAFSQFDFAEYDLVVSMSARFAHGVITKPTTLHVCYMNSPGRMFWEPHSYFENEKIMKVPIIKEIATWFLSVSLSALRMWDFTAAQRCDYIIANSKTPQNRIRKYYGRDSTVIYPHVDFEKINSRVDKSSIQDKDYYLVISRLVSWKKIEVAIQACNQLGKKLIIVGEGPDRGRLEGFAKENVEIVGYVTNERKIELLKNCTALINTQLEDFGIVPLEAMSCGKPVIAFGGGGALETVLPGVTGEFFEEQSVESLIKVLTRFNPGDYDYDICVNQARKFSKKKFVSEIKNFVDGVYLKN